MKCGARCGWLWIRVFITCAGIGRRPSSFSSKTRQELDVVNEIDRYISMPGQALAYKIGQLQISAIRAKAEKDLGPKFDIRAFHDELLKDGALPLDLLETKMNDWIAG